MLQSSLAFKSINLQKESTMVKLCFLGEQTSFSLNNKHKDTHTHHNVVQPCEDTYMLFSIDQLLENLILCE